MLPKYVKVKFLNGENRRKKKSLEINLIVCQVIMHFVC